MIDIPSWLAKDLSFFKCPKCSTDMDKSGIVGIGVHIGQKSKEKTVFFLEYKCVGCGDPTILQFDQMTSKELAQELIEGTMNTGQNQEKAQTPQQYYKQKKPSEKNRKQSLISDRQISSYKRFLDKNEDYQDVLKYIGVSQNQIKKKE